MTEIIEKTWGREEVVVNSDLYCGKFLRFRPGGVGSLHYHERKHETFHVLEGSAFLEVLPIDVDVYVIPRCINKGDTVDLPPRTAHRVSAGPEGVVIVEFSTPHDDADVVRLEKAPDQTEASRG